MFSFFKSKPELEPEAPAPQAEKSLTWAQRLKQGLSRTRNQLGKQIGGLFGMHAKIDEALYEELESILLTSDVGIEATQALLTTLRARVKRDKLTESAQLQAALVEAMSEMLAPLDKPLDINTHQPFVIMMVGVNGAGKTTTIGKLAHHFQDQGKSVLFAAGDTFRAAAREQLMVWGERNHVTVIAQEGGDSAAVIFDAINAAKARGIDVVLADTAGRLPTQMHLMEEIKKVKRVIAKAEPSAPHEVLLVLDGNTGQNGLAQVKAFDDTLGLTGLVVTKLDGTAKGGIVIAISRELGLPVRYVGVGEKAADLLVFDAENFADSLFTVA